MSIVLSSSFLLVVPLLIAAIGGLVHRASGVVNIGLEGGMLIGALIGAVVSGETGSWILGLLAAMLTAGALTWLMTVIITRLNANMIVVGLGFNIFVAGVIGFVLKWNLGVSGTLRIQGLERISRIDIPGLEDVPVMGSILSGKDVLFWVAVALVPMSSWFLANTRYGVRVRSVGDDPDAAQALGVNVKRMRESAGFVAGALAGLGGADLSLGLVGLFNSEMVAGRGFIALAAFFFGGNRPLPTAVACLLFAFFDSLQVSLQAGSSLSQLLSTLPYVIVVIALALNAYQLRLRSRRVRER